MRTLLCATALALLAALPAAAQSNAESSSDRYTRDRPQTNVDRPDQQAQTRDRRHSGEVETLRSRNMTSPNVKGENVPENTETGAAAPEERGNAKPRGGDMRP